MISISLYGQFRVGVGGDPQFLHANLKTIIYPLVYVRETTRGKGVPVDVEGPVENM